jgi:surface protein
MSCASQGPPLTDAGIHAAVDACLAVDPVMGDCPDLTFGPMWAWDVSGVTTFWAGTLVQCVALPWAAECDNWDTDQSSCMCTAGTSGACADQSCAANSGVNNGIKGLFEGKSQFNGAGAGGPLSTWDVSGVTATSDDSRTHGLFKGCSGMTDISGLANWDTSSFTDATAMFKGCSGLTDLSPLSSWDTSNFISMSFMFSGCSGLASLAGLENWDTSKVGSEAVVWNLGAVYGASIVLNGLSYAFQGTSALVDISALSNWDTSNVRSLALLFETSGVTDISALSNWDTSNVYNVFQMFQMASNGGPANLDGLSDWDMSKVEDFRNMFMGCWNLDNNVGVANWDVSSAFMGHYGAAPLEGMFGMTGMTDISGIANWDMTGITVLHECECLTPAPCGPLASACVPT